MPKLFHLRAERAFHVKTLVADFVFVGHGRAGFGFAAQLPQIGGKFLPQPLFGQIHAQRGELRVEYENGLPVVVAEGQQKRHAGIGRDVAAAAVDGLRGAVAEECLRIGQFVKPAVVVKIKSIAVIEAQ